MEYRKEQKKKATERDTRLFVACYHVIPRREESLALFLLCWRWQVKLRNYGRDTSDQTASIADIHPSIHPFIYLSTYLPN